MAQADQTVNDPNIKAPLSDQIRSAIAESFGVDLEDLPPSKRIEELNVDSLDLVELICELEEQFSIEIPEETDYETDRIPTVQDWIDLVTKLVSAKTRGRTKKEEVPF